MKPLFLRTPLLLIIELMLAVQLNAQSLQIDNLVFEGAGIRGIAYCGALMELQEQGILHGVKQLAGTSSGAITASLLAIGYSPEEIYRIIGETNFAKFNDGKGGFIGGFYRMHHHLGWYKGDAFLSWLEHLIEQKAGDKNLTFERLSQLANNNSTYRHLTIAATSMNHQCTLIFDATKYPNMRIADAVRASMAIPFYFEPVVIDATGKVIAYKQMQKQHHICVDGGFTANFCIQAFDKKDAYGQQIPAATLGLRIDSDPQIEADKLNQQLVYQPISGPKDLLQAFYYITKENMNRTNLTDCDWQRTISISESGIGPKVKAMSTNEKQRLINAGRSATSSYLLQYGQKN